MMKSNRPKKIKRRTTKFGATKQTNKHNSNMFPTRIMAFQLASKHILTGNNITVMLDNLEDYYQLS